MRGRRCAGCGRCEKREVPRLSVNHRMCTGVSSLFRLQAVPFLPCSTSQGHSAATCSGSSCWFSAPGATRPRLGASFPQNHTTTTTAPGWSASCRSLHRQIARVMPFRLRKPSVASQTTFALLWMARERRSGPQSHTPPGMEDVMRIACGGLSRWASRTDVLRLRTASANGDVG